MKTVHSDYFSRLQVAGGGGSIERWSITVWSGFAETSCTEMLQALSLAAWKMTLMVIILWQAQKMVETMAEAFEVTFRNLEQQRREKEVSYSSACYSLEPRLILQTNES